MLHRSLSWERTLLGIKTSNATAPDVALSTAGISSKEATGRMSKGDLQRRSSHSYLQQQTHWSDYVKYGPIHI